MESSRPPKSSTSRRECHGPSYSDQRRGAQRAPQPDFDRCRGRQVDGATSRLAHAQLTAQHGVSLVPLALVLCNAVQPMLHRIRELKVQHSNDTLNQTDKDAIVREVNALQSEIGDIHKQTQFNGIKL